MKQSEKKELLKQAWKEIFEIDEVSDDADFFEEGGDSIKAVQLSSWLLQKGVKLDLGRLFSTPVLSELAEALEDTDPVYVPDQMMTKELIGEKLENIMEKMGKGNEQFVGKAEEKISNDEQICDSNQMQQSSNDEQICDPNQMQQSSNNEQICDPNQMQQMLTNGGFGMPAVESEFNMMMSMFQTILSQQQVMFQIMQLMLSRMTVSPRIRPQQQMMPFGQFKMKNPATGMTGKDLPPDVKAALGKEMKKYTSHKVDKPIEKPNVIGIKPAKVTKPERSAEEVLDHVVSGILKKEYSRTKDLFEQGLTSLDTVKMVTRCGEHGYALSMQDIYMKSTFDELVKCMKPGK